MFPSINEFKEKLFDGGARPSLFRMDVTWPVAVPIGNILGSQNMPFHCRMSEIPSNQADPIVIKYAGREVKMAGQRKFSNLKLTIYNDEGFKVRRALEAWQESMNTRESNISPLYAPTADATRGYMGTGKVTQYDKLGQPGRSYVFIDMFPIALSAITLDWSLDNAIEDYTAEFAYQYWVPGEEYAGSTVRNLLGQ